MTTKQKLQLFVPPILFRLKSRLKYGSKIFGDKVSYEDAFKDYCVELNKRHELPMTSIGDLSKNIEDYQFATLSNGDGIVNYYGNFYVLSKYAGIPFFTIPPQSMTIQHGITYELLNCEMMHKEYINFVWSDYIKSLHGKVTTNQSIFAIGAPFMYAQSILSSDQIAAEKKRLGRNLLAFPMHSTSNIDKNYDPTNFLDVLEQEKHRFDSVRVCLYWKDIQRGTSKIFSDAGFECVCCGHIFDQSFLERQKALFEISDATISNAIGSHVGYSILMDTPHRLVPDNFKLVDKCLDEGAEEMNMINTSKNYQEIYDAFLDNDMYIITENQRQIVDKYWGISSKMTPRQLRELINKFY